MATVTIAGNEQGATANSLWSYANDDYGIGRLVNGRDFHESVTFDPVNGPAGTVLAWSYPNHGPGGTYGYPSIIWGNDPLWVHPLNGAPPPAQINSFKTLTANVSVTNSGNPANFDNMFDIYLTRTPADGKSNIKAEVAVFTHIGWSTTIKYIYQDPYMGKVGIAIGHGSFSPEYGIVPLDANNQPRDYNGTIDFKSVFKALQAQHLLTGREWLHNFEFGSEITTLGGTGSTTVNELSYDWETAGTNIQSGPISTSAPVITSNTGGTPKVAASVHSGSALPGGIFSSEDMSPTNSRSGNLTIGHSGVVDVANANAETSGAGPLPSWRMPQTLGYTAIGTSVTADVGTGELAASLTRLNHWIASFAGMAGGQGGPMRTEVAQPMERPLLAHPHV